MRRKSLIIAVLAISLVISSTCTSMADWEQNTDFGARGRILYYRDDNTGQLVSGGWKELPWKDGVAWFCFREDGSLYVNCVTPDGYFVDYDGVWFDENNNYEYNWSTERELESISNIHFSSGGANVEDYFPDFGQTKTLEECKQYFTEKGAVILECTQRSEDDYSYIPGVGATKDTWYFTDFVFTYKGLEFSLSPQDWEKNIRPVTGISVKGSADEK